MDFRCEFRVITETKIKKASKEVNTKQTRPIKKRHLYLPAHEHINNMQFLKVQVTSNSSKQHFYGITQFKLYEINHIIVSYYGFGNGIDIRDIALLYQLLSTDIY